MLSSIKGEETRFSMKVLTVLVLIGFLVYTMIILTLWMSFLPNMEHAAEETQKLIEKSGGETSTVQSVYFSEMRMVYTISLICFGLLDGVFAYLLWKGKMPNSRLYNVIGPQVVLYSTIRGIIGGLIITQLSIGTFTGHDPRLMINMLYLVIAISSVISLIIIFYIKMKYLRENNEEDVTFKIPEDASF